MRHLIRHKFFITNKMEGRINGSKGRGRLRKTFIREMVKVAGCDEYSDSGIKKRSVEVNFCYDKV